MSLTPRRSSLPSAAVATNERRSTQLRLRVENTPALPSEIWLLLCRHLHGKSDADEFIGLSLVKSWKGARQIGGPTRVDTNVGGLVSAPVDLANLSCRS